ncbi:hypothetical protein BC936DRAFT_146392 [Jimgerdemannia flammicorona]|uniref:Plus3 domain-containing protein n=1 Tax=Jimgerdemannia flammicorona TaxID=994334 RepID=A0A433DLG0_9FUNG|nr:hypothetical protein BC936DRAFT_146392 [Jimgerdemannia flammicorona]
MENPKFTPSSIPFLLFARLAALPEVEREQILNERAEKRQEMLERKQIKQQIKLKMLKEGKGDDSSRRSSRAKDTTRATQSRGLTELKRRREEKSTRSSHRRHGSESPERRKRRRSRSIGSDDEYGSESQESEEEEDGKKSKRLPTLDELNSIRLPRTSLEKWMHAPFFEKTVIGCFTRIMLGMDPVSKARVYRVTEITDVADYNKSYRVETQLTNKCLTLKHGKAIRNFTMDIISNQAFTQSEYTRYLTTLENESVRPPTLEHVDSKREDLAAAQAYVLTDKEVEDMIQKKRALSNVPNNVAAEKAQLLTRIEQAKDDGDDEAIRRLEARVRQIENLTAGGSGHEQLDAWAKLNKKNRGRDQVDLRVAEKKQVEERRKLIGANALDPFARRKTQPVLVHTPMQAPDLKAANPTGASGTATASSVPPGSALALLSISVPRLSETAQALARAARPMSKYEEMVAEQDLDVDLDDDD